VRYIQRRAADYHGRIVSIGQLILFSTETGNTWLLDPAERLAARLARDGDSEPIHIEAAKAMLANPDIGVTQIAHRLGVSASTLYRYTAARTANLPDGFREHVEGKAVS
jgi:hypothetical protein